MAVDVIWGHRGATEVKETYKDGAATNVENGHLVVRAATKGGASLGRIIAVFAPGNWQFARVVGGGENED